MIFRLEYKNKALKTARVDIVTPTGTGVETVEGTGYPFQWKYEGDKKNKGLMFLSSSAEINIYETPLFNIDTLKTSGEKDIRVNYYIDSVLEWTGFVIPDFFSREIGGDGVVSMVASDRLSVLDSEVLEGLPVTVTLRTLLSSCLAKTGLTLPLKTVVDFAISGTTQRVLDYKIRSQRLTDTKGRSVNCKDIIKSILVATNSKLMQRKGEWWVVNKMQHELGSGRVYTSPTAFTNYVEDLISFTDVTRGAMRTIAPVAGGVGVFQEYGGGKLIPDNYNFKNGLTGWANYNGFVSSTNNRRVLGYTQSGNIFTPIYDDAGTSEPYLVNRNISPIWVLFPPPSLGNIPLQWDPYAIKSTRIISPVISGDSNAVKVTVDVNAVGLNNSFLPFSVVLKRPGRENLFFNRSNEWQPRAIAQLLSFKNDNGGSLAAVSAGMSVSAVISADSSGEVLDDVGSYTIEVLIFGSGIQGDNTVGDNTTLINSASVQFSAASNDTPKGTLYKADQGGGSYTKIHDTETTVFGDYLTGGLNGYFYNYAPDDTSSLLAPNGSRSQPAWVNTYTQNTEPLPLLQQTIRQMRRMFSVAHDFIKGEIDVADFDPLSVFEDCERRFVIVEAEFDFLRGSLQVVLEEVAYQNLTVREYIYSYFGEGDEGIRGISGISAGSSGGGGGGGVAPEPSWLENEITIDPESGLLSVDGWHVKGDLIIEGQVNQWLAQQLVVDDARIQVNRKQGGATVDSGLVIYNKDTSTEVSSLVYDIDGIWRAGGQRLYTDAYKPLADNATNLGGYSAASYPRKAENAVITGAWKIDNNLFIGGTGAATERLHVAGNARVDGSVSIRKTSYASASDGIGFSADSAEALWKLGVLDASTTELRLRRANNEIASFSNSGLSITGNISAVSGSFSGTLDVTGAGAFGGNLTTQGNLSAVDAALSGTLAVTAASTFGGNVGTSNFASQLQGWRVTPQGQADFRHIYTDELQAKAFTADISQALVGSDVLTKSVAKLAQNFTVTVNGTTAPLYVEELEGFAGLQVFAVNDILLIRIFDRSGGGLLIKNVWVEVVSYVGTTNNVQQFTVNVINSGGIAGQMAYAGSMILDYGQSGSGLIQRTVLDQHGSPYSRVTTWENNPWTPENFTLHYQSGNLNGLANAEGWGVYSQNSFLTGKLLVGDLTKVGQYMEYENGQLNIKGQITVTGGNAATKEDVDAVQVGGRNLFFKSGFASGTAGWGMYGATGLSVSQDKPITIPGVNTISWELSAANGGYFQRFRSPNGSSIADYFQQGQRYTVSAWLKASAPSTFRISAEGVTGGTAVLSLTTEWQLYTHTFIGDPIRHTVSFYGYTAGIRYYLCMPKLELGNRATDWTPAPEDVDAKIADTKLYVEYSTDGTSWHTTFQANDVYMRQKTGVNGTWTGAIKIVGKDGTSVSIKGRVATSASLPSSASLGDGYVAEDTGHLWVWTGSWTDAGQIQGDNGANSYIHIAYADDSQGGGFSHNPSGKSWIGTYADFTATDSDTPSDYTWMYAKGQQGEPGISVSEVDVEFAKNTNPTTAPTTGWTTTAPTLAEGEQLWTRTKTTYSSGNPTYSTPANITPKTGAPGTGVSSITEQYYLSTSKTTQTGGSWVESPPAWEAGKYMWTRVQIVYENPTSTDYTDPIVSAEWDAIDTLKDRVETTLGLADLEGINETLITDGKVRTALLEVTDIVAQGITAGHVEGLTLNFDKGTIGGWGIGNNLLYAGSWDPDFGAGLGIKLDAVNNSIMAQRLNPGNSVEMFYRSAAAWGLVGKIGNATIFQLGSTNQIAGINFDDSRIYTENWELNKDGSAQFDGSVITGLIQSQNWDGEKGTRINLIDGSMDYGNVIHVNANAGEISFRDLNADRLGVRLGDFDLSPAVAGASYDQNLSLRALGGGYNWSLTRWISPLGIGANESVLTTVSQNTYNFSYPLQAELGRSFQNLFTGLTLQEGYTGGLSVKVTVYLDDTIIHQSESQIPSYFGAFSQPTDTLSMPVNFNFTGSGQLKVKIELTGFGGYRDYQGNQYHPTSVVSLGATTIKVTPSTSVTELSTKGFQSLWGPTKYFRVYDKVGFDNFVETRGTQMYLSPNGSHGLRITDTGVQIKRNGGAWTTL